MSKCSTVGFKGERAGHLKSLTEKGTWFNNEHITVNECLICYATRNSAVDIDKTGWLRKDKGVMSSGLGVPFVLVWGSG